VEAKEPKMLYFALHISEDGSQATTVQVYADADAENLGNHMGLVEAHIRATHELLDSSSMRMQLFGTRPRQASTRCASSRDPGYQ
jgi:hypothetical protein